MVKKQIQATNPMAALLKAHQPPRVIKGHEIDAKIISLSKKTVTFDIGAKAHALLGQEEIKEISTYLPYLKIGQVVHARIIAAESKDGYPVLSLRKLFQKGKWSILLEKKEKEEDIEVICGEYGKGGVFIDFMAIRGVIPKIQLIGEALTHPEKLRGQKIKVKILEADEKKNRLVVSQKAAVLKTSQKELKAKFNKIKEGEKYKATVLGVSEFGAFCEVEGVEGLIHISEISWEKVADPSAHLRQGETVDVMVVEKNPVDLKLNLSLKRLLGDPWKKIEEKYPKDKELTGEVVRREKYGYFVRFEPGVEGLIHISKLGEGTVFKTGQKVKVYIEKINEKGRRISLLLPQKERPVTYR